MHLTYDSLVAKGIMSHLCEQFRAFYPDGVELSSDILWTIGNYRRDRDPFWAILLLSPEQERRFALRCLEEVLHFIRDERIDAILAKLRADEPCDPEVAWQAVADAYRVGNSAGAEAAVAVAWAATNIRGHSLLSARAALRAMEVLGMDVVAARNEQVAKLAALLQE